MFGIGTTEFLVIIVVAILVLGPEHLPRIMRTVSKVMSDFRRVSTEFQRTINLEASQEEWERQQAEARKKKRKKRKEAATAVDAPQQEENAQDTTTARDTTKKTKPDTPAAAAEAAPADELAADLPIQQQAPSPVQPSSTGMEQESTTAEAAPSPESLPAGANDRSRGTGS